MIAELENRGERRPGLIILRNLGMRLSNQPVSTLEVTENDRTYVTLGWIVDMRVNPALEEILSLSSDFAQVQPTHNTLKYSGSVCGSSSNLERWISKKLSRRQTDCEKRTDLRRTLEYDPSRTNTYDANGLVSGGASPAGSSPKSPCPRGPIGSSTHQVWGWLEMAVPPYCY